LQQARFRIGDYELREPDYRQICLWAEDLEMTPDELQGSVGVLASSPATMVLFSSLTTGIGKQSPKTLTV
jgi:hypothetical protein